MIQKQKIILDTDIGSDHDDIYALALAANSPELEIEGITIVGGKALLRAQIALKMLKLLGKEKIPVIMGCEQPLLQEKMPWWTTFKPWGHEGEGFLTPQDSDLTPVEGHASDFIISKILQYPGKVTLVPVGPLTNVALAIIKEPKIISNIKEIIMTGGLIDPHKLRISPFLDHNLTSDPDATKVVLNSGIPVTLIGWNATRKVNMSADRFNKLKSNNTSVVNALVGMTERWFTVVKRDWSELHDPVAVGVVVDESFIKTEKFYIECKIRDGVLETIPYERIEFIPTKPPHIKVALDAEGDRFWEFLYARLIKRKEDLA